MDAKLEVFILFAKEDRDLFLELKKHLAILEMQGLINVWDEDQIIGGIARKQEIEFHLQKAALILLLVSAYFMASHEYYALAKQALQTHTPPEKYVVPVLLHDVEWEHSDFGHLTPLPTNRKPVSNWPNLHAAFLDVAKGVRTIVEAYKQPVVDHHAIELVKTLRLTITAPDNNKYITDVSADILVDRLLRDFLGQWLMVGNHGPMHFSLCIEDVASHSLNPSSTLREAGLTAGSNLMLVSEALAPNEAISLTVEDDRGDRYVTTVLLNTAVGQLAEAFLRTRDGTGEAVVEWMISSRQTKQLRLAESLFSQGVCDGALLRIDYIATAVKE
ncbi:MAG TPA: toll/interleukin-1 receptor domain-containing protein [Ktedonobacteraceae bacterium]|jgi:hypothetical protein